MPFLFVLHTPDIMKIFRNISNSASSVNFRRFSFKKKSKSSCTRSSILNFFVFVTFDIESRKFSREKNDGYPIVSPNGNDCQCQGSSDFMSGQQ